MPRNLTALTVLVAACGDDSDPKEDAATNTASAPVGGRNTRAKLPWWSGLMVGGWLSRMPWRGAARGPSCNVLVPVATPSYALSVASICPFCELGDKVLLYQSDLVVAFRDGYPVSPGHSLVVTRRHVPDYFTANDQERRALWEAVDAVSAHLQREFTPDGFNVGFNAGSAAGQTVMHVHLHVIPRFDGDMVDPRGGVRGVIPHKRIYTPNG